jgi:hypothetical protein
VPLLEAVSLPLSVDACDGATPVFQNTIEVIRIIIVFI